MRWYTPALLCLLFISSCDDEAPVVPLPDLIITGIVAADTPRAIIRNIGTGEVAPGKGNLMVFVGGNLIRVVSLGSVPDQSFRQPGGSSQVSLPRDIRNVPYRVMLRIDTDNEIAESNEFQNSFAFTSGLFEFLREERPWERERVTDSSRARLPDSLVAALDRTHPSAHQELLVPYRDLLQDKIRNNLIWRTSSGSLPYAGWSGVQKEDLDRAVIRLEKGYERELQGPPAPLEYVDTGHLMVKISERDAWQMFIANAAQSLWIEKNRLVQWRLTDFSDADLQRLLNSTSIIQPDAPGVFYYGWSRIGSITPWCPDIAYNFLKSQGLIKSTQRASIFALTDWMRSRLIHFNSSHSLTGQYGYDGPPPADKVLYPLLTTGERKKHITWGCWGTTGLYNAVLRSINIPVQPTSLFFSPGVAHSSPHFPSAGLKLVHGDDPYSQYYIPSGGIIPVEKLFYTDQEFETQVLHPVPDCVNGTCNNVYQQLACNIDRRSLKTVFDHNGDYLLYTYARLGRNGTDSVLRFNMSAPPVTHVRELFTPEERQAMLDSIELRLTRAGGGDMEAGKTRVRQRFLTFQNNK